MASASLSMPPLRALLNPAYPWTFLKSRLQRLRLKLRPNERGSTLFPPGHFHSPLLDIETLEDGTSTLPHDGPENWEHIPLRLEAQQALYEELMSQHPPVNFPATPSPEFRYHYRNDWFPLADAFTLSGLLRRQKPRRIIEVGSGFSTAVMLDTLDRTGSDAQITCLEPHPQRLQKLLRSEDAARVEIKQQPLQETPVSLFSTLEADDFLFIDSSHVAKAGSDVVAVFLRVLPALKPGVWVHIHDVFYPQSYPIEWIREGRAWNESLFLRAFLLGNPTFEVRAFNSHAAASLPASFWSARPEFLQNGGGSLWLQRTAL